MFGNRKYDHIISSSDPLAFPGPSALRCPHKELELHKKPLDSNALVSTFSASEINCGPQSMYVRDKEHSREPCIQQPCVMKHMEKTTCDEVKAKCKRGQSKQFLKL